MTPDLRNVDVAPVDGSDTVHRLQSSVAKIPIVPNAPKSCRNTVARPRHIPVNHNLRRSFHALSSTASAARTSESAGSHTTT